MSLEAAGMFSSTCLLRVVKIFHTIVWAFFVACIFAIPVFGCNGRYSYFFIFNAIVSVELIVLLFNRGKCPLTAVAARYTLDRRDNFDIYLPEWIARHNKLIFGGILIAGELAVLTRWAISRLG
jgi:hypothetical protein